MSDFNEYRTYVAMVFIFISFVMNIFTLEALRRSRKLSYNVRVLSINMIVADLILCAFCIAMFFFAKSITSIKMDENCMITFMVGAGCFWTYFATSFMVTAMAVDRFISMKFPYQYLKIVSEKRCKSSCYVLWVVSLLLAISFHLENREKFYQCYHQLYRNKTYLTGLEHSRFFTIGLANLVILIVNMFAYSAIIIIVWRKKTFVSQGQRRLLKKLGIISLAYAILHGPFNITTIVIGVIGLKNYSTFVQAAVLITSLMIFVDPILYTWRYKTCRYQMMIILCSCSKNRVNDIRQRNKQFYSTFRIESNLVKNDSHIPSNSSSICRLYSRTSRVTPRRYDPKRDPKISIRYPRNNCEKFQRGITPISYV